MKITTSILFSIILIFLSCIQENAAQLKNKEASNITKIDTIQERSKTFVFYKAFEFCHSEVEYFTPEEARNLYAEKTISVDLKSSKIEDGSVAYTKDKIECIKENLNLGGKIEVKFFKNQDSFPFDNLKLLNDQYLITSRDGYYFVFMIAKDDGVVKINEKKEGNNLQKFSSLLDHKITGLSTLNEKEVNPYKKFGLDFSTLCYCDSPSMYIDTNLKVLTIFNYCNSKKSVSSIKDKIVYKNIKLEIEGNNLVIIANAKLNIKFSKKENLPIFKIEVEGNFPTQHIGGDLKKLFTSEPEKFPKIDCGDFDG